MALAFPLAAAENPPQEPAPVPQENVAPVLDPAADQPVAPEATQSAPAAPENGESKPEDNAVAALPSINEEAGEPSAVREDARSISGSYLAMQFARSQGDKEAAVTYLRDTLKNDPHNDSLLGQLMVMQLLSGDVASSVALAEKLAKTPDHELITDMLLAVGKVKQGDFKEADAVLNKAFDVGFGSLWLPLVSAWLDLGQDKIKKPLTIEQVAPKAGNVAPLVYYHIGLINDLAGFHEQAIKDLQKAVSDKSNIPFRVMQALAYHYRKSGNEKDFEKLLEVFRSAHPELAFALTAEDALGQTPTVSTVQDGVAEVLFTMASILFTADGGQDTLLYLQMALYLRPDFPSAQMILGSLLEAGGDYAESNRVYQSIRQTSPFYSRAQLRSALNLDRQGKTPEALAKLDAMSKEDPSRHEALVAMGDILRGHSRYIEAADAYTKALERLGTPRKPHWAIYFARGSCYERLGDWPGAEGDLRKALELHPDQPDVLNYLGYSLLVRGDNIKEAKTLLERAIAARPNDAHIIDSMGWALYNLGDYENAIAYLERAIELMPSDPTVNEHLGDAYWQGGRQSEARFQWDRALVYSPEPEQETAIRHKLEAGLPATGVPVPPTAKQQVPEITTPQ